MAIHPSDLGIGPCFLADELKTAACEAPKPGTKEQNKDAMNEEDRFLVISFLSILRVLFISPIFFFTISLLPFIN